MAGVLARKKLIASYHQYELEIILFMMDNSFLIAPTQSKTAILIVDASGSVRSKYGSANDKKTIFDKFEDIVRDFTATSFHIIFWNSDNAEGFPKGFIKLPFIVTKDTLH